MRGQFWKRLAVFALVAGMLFTLAPMGGAQGTTAGETAGAELLCLNVGKADCLLLRVQGKAFLIDTGYAYNYGLLTTALARFGVERLEAVFLTHPHNDHEGGLSLLAASDMPVGAWYAPALYFDVKPQKHALVVAAALRGEEVTWLNAGDTIPISDTAALHVLGPVTLSDENENNNSLVLHVQTPDGDMLLAGDMKLAEEYTLLKSGVVPQCAVLKAGHHGDGGASGDSFVRAVMPKLAVISTSTAEEPDTPDAAVLARFDRYGVRTIVTQDTADGVLVTLRGGEISAQDIAFDKPEAAKATLVYDEAGATVTLHNTGAAPLSLAGCMLYAVRGNNAFLLPEGTLAPGGQYAVGARETAGADATWDIKRLLNKSKWDEMVLYDAFGREIARTDNGKIE